MAQSNPAVLGPVDSSFMQLTPGPWQVTCAEEWRTASGEHAQFGRFDISAGNADPAATAHYRVASVSNVNNSGQNRANALLISAAPDLLAALQMLYAETADYIRLNNIGDMDNQCMRLARAALAKVDRAA